MDTQLRSRVSCLRGVVCAAAVLWPALAAAQTPQPDEPLRITAPTVVVTAQKEPVNEQKVPVSVTAVSSDVITSADIRFIGDTAIFAPNTFFTDFSARKLSFPRFRGVSSGPGNPAITTYLDGVPQLHTNISSPELVDVQQVELVRGAQSALFGRNALGGLINVSSMRPSMTKWSGAVRFPFGNADTREVRASVSGPVTPRLAIGVAAGKASRDGFTVNGVTGHAIDDRSSTTGKVQALWTPTDKWEARAIVGAERGRDGDYGLQDLGALRASPFRTQRDFEGFTHRDILSTTLLTRHTGARVTFSTTTGIIRWTTEDQTDLDYTPLPLVRRRNQEEALQFTQEVRVASAAPLAVSPNVSLKWQAGAFVFTQGYDQSAVNSYSPFVLNQAIPFAVNETSPQSALDDAGVGVYGQGTLTIQQNFDVILGARLDHESKDATLDTMYSPTIAAPRHVAAARSFTAVSPNVTAAYRLQGNRMVYASVGKGFKAGGFNAASPAGAEAFDEEHAWHAEAGLKSSWAEGRLLANLAIFHIDWQDLQLNVPNPAIPAQFYVANVGKAGSTGAEVELTARPRGGLDVFGTLGITRARFGGGSVSSGVNVSDNRLPSTPEYTASFGASYTKAVTSAVSAYGRADVLLYGSFFYDDFNTASQEAYSLANLRAGLRYTRFLVEAWTRNAFDTKYIPLALQYGSPSGFIGEMGRPRTFGVTAGVTF